MGLKQKSNEPMLVGLLIEAVQCVWLQTGQAASGENERDERGSEQCTCYKAELLTLEFLQMLHACTVIKYSYVLFVNSLQQQLTGLDHFRKSSSS